MQAPDGLHVVGIRYRNSLLAPHDERALDAYAASGVYASSGIPVTMTEPRLSEEAISGNEPRDIGVLCGEIAGEVARGLRAGRAVLVVGGNCVHATGVLGGLQEVRGQASRVGLVWLDAHGDFNTPLTSESGSLGGMPVAVAAGLAHADWRELSRMRCPIPLHRILIVGARDLDEPERRLLTASAVALGKLTPEDWGTGLEESLAFLLERCDHIYLHVDCDVLDESYVPNHRTRVPCGPDLDRVAGVLERVMESGKVAVFGVVSVSGEGPGHDVSVRSGIELLERGLRSWCAHGVPCGEAA